MFWLLLVEMVAKVFLNSNIYCYFFSLKVLENKIKLLTYLLVMFNEQMLKDYKIQGYKLNKCLFRIIIS